MMDRRTASFSGVPVGRGTLIRSTTSRRSSWEMAARRSLIDSGTGFELGDQVDADLEILASKLSTQEECKAAEQSLIDQGFCLNSPMQILKEDIHKLERYTSSSADEFPLKEKPTYHEQLKSLLKPICEALTALGVCEVVAQFSGSGDEGEFYEIEYLPASETRVVPKDLADALYDWLGYALPGGWEINEGSSGTVTIDVPATIAHVDIDLNEMTTTNEEYDI